MSQECTDRQGALQGYERFLQAIPQAQKQYDRFSQDRDTAVSEADQRHWKIPTLEGEIQSLQTSTSDANSPQDNEPREKLRIKEQEIIDQKQGIAPHFQKVIADVEGERERAMVTLRRRDAELRQGSETVTNMASKDLTEITHETNEAMKCKEEVRRLTAEIAAVNGAMSTKSQVRLQGTVKDDNEKHIREL